MDASANFYWLVGLLEGEGTFLAPSPSRPNEPRVEVEMKDYDVIARAGVLLGVSVVTRLRQRRRKGHLELETVVIYRVRVSGRRAVRLLRTIKAYMSGRRQLQISRALACYHPRTLKQERETRQPYAFTALCAATMCMNPPAHDTWCAACVGMPCAA